MTALRKVRNSMWSQRSRSASCFARHLGAIGRLRAIQALRVQASDAMTM